ncbi:MAG TPA: T9SS type A sorting domain-containing protein [Melioribacteraceae bacterium]|nr:T9SS type A sorting domain-containing protein [Melioribacteraceae bacterium]
MKKLKLIMLKFLIAIMSFVICCSDDCYAQPRIGDWTIPCGFGQFVIKVGCNGTCITDIIYTWSNFHCDGITLVSGSIHSIRTGGWTITNNSFTIQTSVNPGTMTINGTFNQNGNEVSGNYSFNVFGTICSGNWGPIASEVEDTNYDIPAYFILSQNYPNPFNTITSIKYALPVESSVRISIYNILGENLITLIDGIQPSGNYKVSWDASKISSGIYFYRIAAIPLNGRNSFTEVKKMILLK